MMTWSYGVTTIPARRETTLPRTLASLAAAGFDKPRLFVDGCKAVELLHHYKREWPDLEMSARDPVLGAWGNWYLALAELYMREPVCERYAIFQDDVIAVRGLREYLDRCRYPDGRDGRPPGFWNLVTMRSSEWAVAERGVNCGWIEGATCSGDDPKQMLQKCSGALGLVFNREAVGLILSARSAVLKPISTDRPRHNIDGAVVTAMNLCRVHPETGERWPWGWREYVHGPSLLKHVGERSSVREGKVWTTNAETFPGEGVDVSEMVRGNGTR